MVLSPETVGFDISSGRISDLPDYAENIILAFVMKEKSSHGQDGAMDVVFVGRDELGHYPVISAPSEERHELGGPDSFYTYQIFYFAGVTVAWRVYTVVDTVAKGTEVTFLGPYIVQ